MNALTAAAAGGPHAACAQAATAVPLYPASPGSVRTRATGSKLEPSAVSDSVCTST